MDTLADINKFSADVRCAYPAMVALPRTFNGLLEMGLGADAFRSTLLKICMRQQRQRYTRQVHLDFTPEIVRGLVQLTAYRRFTAPVARRGEYTCLYSELNTLYAGVDSGRIEEKRILSELILKLML